MLGGAVAWAYTLELLCRDHLVVMGY
jgi:hypothetical protein